MFCTKCGKEIKEGASFCPYCGAPVGEIKAVGADGKKLPLVPLVAGAAVLLLAGIVGGIFLFRGRSESGTNDKLLAEGTAAADESWQELEPLYDGVEVPVIDIHAVNYAAGIKSPGLLWDSSLFYWLEDVDQESSEDGYLAKCMVNRMLLRNAEDESLIQYEIYRDPETGEIYKIVSIEQGAEEMHLTDYYYQGGSPNFTFSRNDSVYTPTYATPTKTGERYYFNSDVMARWRMIQVPSVIEEYVLTLTDAGYSQYDYFEESEERQNSYDETELRELNASRNTFDAVTAAGNGIGLVEGRVIDTAGKPVAGVTVDILRVEDGVLLYRAVTGEDGSFRIFVYLEDVECSIIVRGNGTYDSNSIQGVMLSRASGGSSFGNLLMHRVDGDEYPVHINVYAAADVRTDDEGSLLRDLLTGAKVSLRAGAGAHTGEVLQTLEADGNGKVTTTLPAGTYTAQIDVEGYTPAYVTVEVAEQETTAEGYVLPTPEADQTGIVLTWEGEADLDLTLFTPYQSTDGDMAHIGGRITDDGNGNRLVADNGAGCEVMYVNTSVPGNYKLYVNNYTESEAGNYGSDQLSTLNIHIYIYDSTGLIAEYSFPAGQNGVVWEVADLNGSRVMPAQRVYVSLEGKSWWTDSKWTLDLEENVHLKNLMDCMVEAAWGNTEYDWYYYYGKNVARGMQAWADELYRGNWEMIGDWLATLAVTDYSYPKFSGNDDRADIPYIDEIMTQPEVAQILENRDLEGGWILTKDQLEYLAYAAGGNNWKMQSIDEVMNAHGIATETVTERVGDSVMFNEGAAGSMDGIYLQNISTEYIGGGNWKVTADSIYYCEPGFNVISNIQFADITFTVIRNPDSCFDGYSITGMSVTPTDHSGWAQTYYDYLISNWGNNEYVNDNLFYFINLDGDGIPEIYRAGGYTFLGDSLIYYSQDGVNEDDIYGWGDARYIMDSGLLYCGGGRMGWASDIVYLLTNGELQILGEGSYEFGEDVSWHDYNWNWNGESVTEEEYGARLNNVFDTTKSWQCNYNYEMDYDAMIQVLQEVINN